MRRGDGGCCGGVARGAPSVPRLLVAVAVALAMTGAAAVLVADEATDNPRLALYRANMTVSGLEPTGAGALSYFRELQPDDRQREHIDQLVRQLGHDEFSIRESATQLLLRLNVTPIETLVRAQDSDDPEVAWRARLILQSSEDRSAQLMLAALKVVAAERPPETTAVLMDVVPLCRSAFLIRAVHEALRACATSADVPLLRRHLQSESALGRTAAAIALVEVLHDDARGEVYPLLNDADETVCLALARTLADKGDRRSLAPLVRLLESPQTPIRTEAAFVLRGLTGRQFGFVPYQEESLRAVPVAAWKKWLAEEGATAPLAFPLRSRSIARGSLFGNTLISTGSRGRVYEQDPAGKIVWSHDLPAWSAEKLINGNVLIGSYNARKVVEVDAAGNVVWEMADISAMRAKPLENGNFLIADFNGNRAIEVNREKKTVWQYATPDECFDVERLANGNTLVGCPNLIREVSPDGATVNEIKIDGRLNGLQALDSGNILVANYGTSKVYELTPAGEVVWEFAEPHPCDVFQLADGSLLIATSARIIELGVDHATVRQIGDAQYGSARR
jgi:HEAT repeat protein